MQKFLTLLFMMTALALCLDASGQTATVPTTASPAVYPTPAAPVTPKPAQPTTPAGPMTLTNAPAGGPPNLMAPGTKPTPVPAASTP